MLNRVFACALLWALACLFAFAAPSQQQGDVYKIQPEDVLRILVYNETQVNADIPVGKDGNISAQFVGIVHAQGKTTTEVEKELVELYRKYLRIKDPRVSVSIVHYRTLKASVGGFVNRPSQYEVRPGDTLISLLNQGGGPIPDRADLRRATLRRANSRELIPVDLYSMLIQGDTSQNYEIEDGDELTIPEETKNRILVQGAIQQPGVYPYKEPMTLADAITQAHGEVRLRSMLSKILVIREQKGQPGHYLRIECNFVNFIRKGDATQNIPLAPGDIVWIPESKSPDFSYISGVLNTAFYFNSFYYNGLFGFKLFH